MKGDYTDALDIDECNTEGYKLNYRYPHKSETTQNTSMFFVGPSPNCLLVEIELFFFIKQHYSNANSYEYITFYNIISLC